MGPWLDLAGLFGGSYVALALDRKKVGSSPNHCVVFLVPSCLLGEMNGADMTSLEGILSAAIP